MENVFEVVITKLVEVGFYDLLIFVFSLTLFYTLLRKMKLLGESPLINAFVAFVIAFMIFGFPVIIGFSLTMPLISFFTQSFVWILVFFIGFLMASFFYPDLPKLLAEKFTSRTMLSVGITIAISAVIMSGLLGVFWATPSGEGRIMAPFDTTITATGVIIFVILLIIASQIATRASG